MARPASDIAPRVLHAARERFLQEGVDGASLRKIAQDAGTNIGMVYYYFKTKDELFLAVVEEVYAEVLRELETALSSCAPPGQRLAALYQRIARMNDDEFKIVRLILREALISSARLERLAERFRKGHLPLVAGVLREGAQDGSLRTDMHPGAMFAATFSLAFMPQLLLRLVSASSLPIAGQLPSTAEAGRMLHELLLHGIAAPHKPGS